MLPKQENALAASTRMRAANTEAAPTPPQEARRRTLIALGLSAIVGLISACSSTRTSAPRQLFVLHDHSQVQEIVLYAMGLLGTGYRFGGRNPEAGLDCSGMVSYIVEQVSGRKLPHNAAKIAAITRPIKSKQLQPGDLVFFNTARRRHSHMGIYIGEGKFIHAPSSRGKVQIAKLSLPYFKQRLDGASTLRPRG